MSDQPAALTEAQGCAVGRVLATSAVEGMRATGSIVACMGFSMYLALESPELCRAFLRYSESRGTPGMASIHS